MSTPLYASDVKVALLAPEAMRDPRHPTLAELNAATSLGTCQFDPYPEVRRIARKYTRTPGLCEEYVLRVTYGQPAPEFPACRCDDCT